VTHDILLQIGQVATVIVLAPLPPVEFGVTGGGG